MEQPEKTGERIAKVLARAGVASRREAERMIEAGLVTVNGKVIDSPALNVTPRDRITVDGKPLAEKEPARLWLYYKPLGLVTSAADEKGRQTVFDTLPEDMPRVMSIGRLDLNSEGLLLLTNDGELKRRLELPSTGWLRKYRVRVNGRPEDATLEPLRQGITIEGEAFQPMTVTLDRQQGANAWLTVGLREGRNREIRRAMTAIGLTVNRLIRVSYGPFRLNEMEPGEVVEVKPRVLRDQLGLPPEDEPAAPRPKPRPLGPATGPRGKGGPKTAAGDKPAARGRGGKPAPVGLVPMEARGQTSAPRDTRGLDKGKARSVGPAQGQPARGKPAKPAPRGKTGGPAGPGGAPRRPGGPRGRT